MFLYKITNDLYLSLSTFPSGGLLFGNGTGTPATDVANLFWNNTTKSLSIGAATTPLPTDELYVAGNTVLGNSTGGVRVSTTGADGTIQHLGAAGSTFRVSGASSNVGTGGNLFIKAGDYLGAGAFFGGLLNFYGGDGDTGGDVQFGGGFGIIKGGDISVFGGPGEQGGAIDFLSGSGTTGVGGNVNFGAGSSDTGAYAGGISFYGGASTGTAIAGDVYLQGGEAQGTGAAGNVFIVSGLDSGGLSSNGFVSIRTDASTVNMVQAGPTTDTLAFFGAAPIVQPTTAGAAAAFVAGAGTAVNDASTFDGYTLRQVVRALRNLGLLT